jgi:integrase
MLEEARLQGFIKTNPRASVKFLPETGKDIDILTPEEVRALFPADWREVRADETCCVLNKLAACTGMRLGELLGLRGEYVFDGYVTMARQYSKYGYGDTKTHMERKIPVPGILESASGFPPLPSVRKGRSAYAADIFTLSLILYRLKGGAISMRPAANRRITFAPPSLHSPHSAALRSGLLRYPPKWGLSALLNRPNGDAPLFLFTAVAYAVR